MKKLKLASIDDTNAIIDRSFSDYRMATEELPLMACRGRILAEDVRSTVNVPDYRRSMVDGYAVRSVDFENDFATASVVLEVIGRAEMGQMTALKVERGQAVYVPTGGMVPDGADQVVMEEFSARQKLWVHIAKSGSGMSNIIDVGGDIQKDSIVLKSGKRIRTQEIGAMAAVGKKTVSVFQQPRISILCTGDELISLDEELKPGRIRDMNTITLKMIAEEMGCIVVRNDLVPDDFNGIQGVVHKALSDSDILVVSGGSSVGEKDVTAEVFQAVDKDSVLLHGIRVKPGKPTIIARIQGKPVFGLPGHPVAALNIFRIFVSRALNRIQQQPDPPPRMIQGICGTTFKTASDRDTYQMVRLTERNGRVEFDKVAGESGMITLMTKADGYILVPSSRNQVSQGELFDVIVID